MNRFRSFVFALALIGMPVPAWGVNVPYIESFDQNGSNWRDAAGAILSWHSSGGADGGGHVSTALNFNNHGPNDFVALFRAHDEYASSGGAFVGDWISSGIDGLSFWIRHDASQPLNFFARIAGPNNFPGAGIVEFTPVLPNTWTQIAFDINPGNPNIIYEGGPSNYFSVFGNVGHVQIGAAPGALAGIDESVTFSLDRVSIVPTPSVVSLLVSGCLIAPRRRRRIT